MHNSGNCVTLQIYSAFWSQSDRCGHGAPAVQNAHSSHTAKSKPGCWSFLFTLVPVQVGRGAFLGHHSAPGTLWPSLPGAWCCVFSEPQQHYLFSSTHAQNGEGLRALKLSRPEFRSVLLTTGPWVRSHFSISSSLKTV